MNWLIGNHIIRCHCRLVMVEPVQSLAARGALLAAFEVLELIENDIVTAFFSFSLPPTVVGGGVVTGGTVTEGAIISGVGIDGVSAFTLVGADELGEALRTSCWAVVGTTRVVSRS